MVLKNPSGISLTNVQISAENIESLVSTPVAREKARSSLEKMGFQVCRVSPFAIVVEAPAKAFEKAFQSSLERVGHPGIPKRFSRTEPVGWKWASSPKVPKELSDLVETVAFPQPTMELVH